MPAKGQPSPNRKWASNAEKLRNHREKQKVLAGASKVCVDALMAAFDAGRCSKIMDNLPENPNDALLEIARRLEGKRLIATKFEDPEKRRERERKASKARRLLAQAEKE